MHYIIFIVLVNGPPYYNLQPLHFNAITLRPRDAIRGEGEAGTEER